MQSLLLLGGSANPKRKRGGAKKRRSPAQRAATKRMLAANKSRSGSGPKRRKKRRAVATVRATSPVRRRRARSVTRSVRRSRRGGSLMRGFGSTARGAVPMLKNGLVGGAGAVAIDIAMGYAGKVLPESVAVPLNPDGTTNWLHYATKAALAVGVGMYGGKVIPSAIAAKAAEGALTVMSYQILRGMVPASIAGNMAGMGYVTPARIVNQRGAPTTRPALPLGAVTNFPQSGPGARTMQGLHAVTPQRFRRNG